MIKSTFRRIKFIGLILLIPFITLQAAQIPVNTLADAGVGSLRDAVSMAMSGDTITFGSVTFGGTIELITGEILIDKNLVILGNGTENTNIESNGNSRIFNIGSGAIVVITDLTLAQGGGVDLGGGIFSEGIPLSLENVCSRKTQRI